MEFSRPEYWSGYPFPSPGDLPNPGIKPRSPSLQADSLPAEPQGKPNNTGVGSLSLLQQIFPTQESNQGLLHCRRILYQLSYQGRRILNSEHSQHLACSAIHPASASVLLPGALLWFPLCQRAGRQVSHQANSSRTGH